MSIMLQVSDSKCSQESENSTIVNLRSLELKDTLIEGDTCVDMQKGESIIIHSIEKVTDIFEITSEAADKLNLPEELRKNFKIRSVECSDAQPCSSDCVGAEMEISERSETTDTEFSERKRKLQPIPCKDRCQNKCREKFNENERREIFQLFWSMNYSERKNWLLSCVEETEVKRRRSKKAQIKTVTRNYFINFQGRHVQVCLQYLLKTLNISSQTINYTLKNKTNMNVCFRDRRGKQTARSVPAIQRNFVVNFIENLPAVPSHYCRKNSNRKYLPNEYRSLSNVYRMYKKMCIENERDFVSEKIFRHIFKKKFNIGIHQPKKDKCSACEINKGSEQNITNEQYLQHCVQKEESISLFLAEQERSKSDPEFLCASFDLQKVLNTPHGDSMLLYYSRKYSFYNLSVYESGTKDGFAFLWGECDGKRGANEICSVMYKYLKIVDSQKTITEVSLFCDSCPGQNKNKQMLSMIYHFLQNTALHIKKLKITFLLPGHTYMPVDSMHSIIERFIKRRIIWAPSEWPPLIANSRIEPTPYHVFPLTFSDFKDWTAICNHYFLHGTIKTTQGQKFKITDGKCFLFEKGIPTIEAYLDYKGSNTIFLNLEKKQKNKRKKLFLESVYSIRLPTSKQKYNDLMNLFKKGIIPKRFLKEYETLPYDGKIEDTLPETDEDI